MNRLAKHRCYLCGPMEHANDGGVGWREYVKRELADLNICWLDPCQKPTKDFIEDATTHSLLRSARQRETSSSCARRCGRSAASTSDART